MIGEEDKNNKREISTISACTTSSGIYTMEYTQTLCGIKNNPIYKREIL